MADKELCDDEVVREYFDDADVLSEKIAQMAELIRTAHHCVVYTGAGISTSAGISDFRGPNGVWTRRARGLDAPRHQRQSKLYYPTFAHMALVALHRAGFVKHLVSQNCDGLHRRSGFEPDALSELHGNTNKEICNQCGHVGWRETRCRVARHVHDHRTGRRCPVAGCRGEMCDSIINFGENLPEDQLTRADEESRKADLCLVFGTSLKVTPAADLPCIGPKRKTARLVICNLQKTPKDKYASLLVRGRTDDVLMGVLDALGLELPDFHEQHAFECGLVTARDGTREFVLRRCDGETWDALLSNVDAHIVVNAKRPIPAHPASAKDAPLTTFRIPLVAFCVHACACHCLRIRVRSRLKVLCIGVLLLQGKVQGAVDVHVKFEFDNTPEAQPLEHVFHVSEDDTASQSSSAPAALNRRILDYHPASGIWTCL